MNISELFTKRNIEILSLISERDFALREIAEKIHCSPAKVHQATALFKRSALITTENVKNRLIIRPNRKNPLYPRIKSLINLNKILGSGACRQLMGIGKVGVYGSYAQGTDEKESDIDMIIVTEKKEVEVRALIRNLEQEIGKRVSPLIMKELRKVDPEFYTRLKLTTIELNGDLFG